MQWRPIWEREVQKYSFFNILISALNGGWWSTHCRRRFRPKKESRYSLYRTEGGPQGRPGEKFSPPTGIRFPDRPARSESLYRLSYRGLKYMNSFYDRTTIIFPCVQFRGFFMIYFHSYLKLRKKLVKCYIWSIALYGAETGTLWAVDQKQQESLEMWCWRRMEKVIWTDHVRNEVLFYEITNRCSYMQWILFHC